MNDKANNAVFGLREKFRSLPAKQRESVGVSFLKVKLGVHSPAELQVVYDFLGPIRFELTPENLEAVMNFLHTQDSSAAPVLSGENSLSHLDITSGRLTKYNPDDVETLKEPVKPFSGES